MQRRDISKALLASATGAALVSQRTEAQTCVTPCFAPTPAEIGLGITPDTSYPAAPLLDARRYGPVGNGTDQTTALQNLLKVLGHSTNRSIGFIPAGVTQFSANLDVPAKVNLIGAGAEQTILRPTAAVKICLSLNDNCVIKSFQIDGTATTGATGIRIAALTSQNFNEIDDVKVNNHSGSESVGILVQDSVALKCTRLFAQGNGTNLKISGKTSASFPTTCNFEGCRMAYSTEGPGVLIESGQLVTFTNNCIIEYNKQEGMRILPKTTGIITGVQLEIHVGQSWFEGNYQGDTTRYHLAVGDGTALGGIVVRVSARDCYFNTNNVTCKSIDMNGSAVIFKISNPRFNTGVQGGTISIHNGAFGDLNDWNQNFTYTNLVTDDTRTTSAASGVNTFSPNLVGFVQVPGSGSITANGRWTKIGRRVFWNITLVASGGAAIGSTANTSVLTSTTMPLCLTMDTCQVVRTNDTASLGIGYMFGGGGTNTIGAPPWAASAGTYVFSLSYEIIG